MTASKLMSIQQVSSSRRPIFLLRFIVLPAILVSVQFYQAATLRKHIIGSAQSSGHEIPVAYNLSLKKTVKTASKIPRNEAFGACLMVKEDNDLLFEWLAYHYTILPLRYVFVGSDEGNKQNPEEVFRRWKESHTGLEYKILNMNETGENGRYSSVVPSVNETSRDKLHEDAHHAFVRRQRTFLSTCVHHLKLQGIQWVLLTDTDEFLVMNRLSEEESLIISTGEDNGSGKYKKYRRRRLLEEGSKTTVMDVLKILHDTKEDLGPCYTMPRLLYGALENATCPNAAVTMQNIEGRLNIQRLSTLRFTQHAAKGDFSKSKYGKVMINLAKISNDTIHQVPRNIHRPYKPECAHAAIADFEESMFYLNHYIGSWERYSSRIDDRRNRHEWELRAYLSDGTSCHHDVHSWLPNFLELVGEADARYLLGMTESLTSY